MPVCWSYQTHKLLDFWNKVMHPINICLFLEVPNIFRYLWFAQCGMRQTCLCLVVIDGVILCAVNKHKTKMSLQWHGPIGLCSLLLGSSLMTSLPGQLQRSREQDYKIYALPFILNDFLELWIDYIKILYELWGITWHNSMILQ